MEAFDAVVIGAGPAGLVAGAVLSSEGRKTLVCEKSRWIGGRAMALDVDGFKLNLGGHLLEDSGSGITAIFKHLGVELRHGAVSSSLPVFREGKWGQVQEMYQGKKDELKKIISILGQMDCSEFDRLDDVPLRKWLLQHTRSEEVIALFECLAVLECMTEEWYDHSASDNLFVRKLHYGEKRMAGYSFWPEAGWDGIFGILKEVILKNGGEVRLHTPVHRVVIHKGQVEGVIVSEGEPSVPGELAERKMIQADKVVCTVPVWNVLEVVSEDDLPQWYSEQIKYLAQEKFKVCWLGYYVASREPIFALDPKEMCTWLSAPKSRLGGFAFLNSALDPKVAPQGAHLWVCGATFLGTRSKEWVDRKIKEFDEDLRVMFPALGGEAVIWKKRHLVGSPPFGLVQKPTLVGTYRPAPSVPSVKGLYFASDTFRSRGVGVDRAARAGLTAAELALGKRIEALKETWRY